MITFTEISALVAAVEIIVTTFKRRAPGMSLNRIPLFVWAMVVTSFMVIFVMPAVMLASSFLAMDRLTGVSTHFFNLAEGGDAILWQHLFWFFGHPELYIIFIPATGLVSLLVVTFSRRKMFGYTSLVFSLISTGFIGFENVPNNVTHFSLLRSVPQAVTNMSNGNTRVRFGETAPHQRGPTGSCVGRWSMSTCLK